MYVLLVQFFYYTFSTLYPSVVKNVVFAWECVISGKHVRINNTYFLPFNLCSVTMHCSTLVLNHAFVFITACPQPVFLPSYLPGMIESVREIELPAVIIALGIMEAHKLPYHYKLIVHEAQWKVIHWWNF